MMVHPLRFVCYSMCLMTVLPLVGCSASGEDETPTATPDEDSTPTATPDGDSTPTATPSADGVGCPADNASWTVGWLGCTDAASDGYVFFAPLRSTTSFLIDQYGRQVHTWPSTYMPGQAVHLLEDGSILRTGMVNNSVFKAGAAGGQLQLIEWDGTLSWNYTYSTTSHLTHHDAIMLPSGNVLALSWEVVSQSNAISMGRDPSTLSEGSLWNECVIELKITGTTSAEVVWKWCMLDHVIQDYDSAKDNYGDVAAHPERLDINYTGDGMGGMDTAGADWIHFNAVDYNADLDQIVLSSKYMSEIYVIDHSTTTEEAASSSGGAYGKGGDFLYRWGNPQVYRADGERVFYNQHAVHWVEDGLPGAGRMMVFNNGNSRTDGRYSTADEWTPSLNEDGSYGVLSSGAFGPEELTWRYKAATPTDLYADRISNAQRLLNGNTLVVNGAYGKLYEVTTAGDVVWEYVNPVLGDSKVASQGTSLGGQDNSVFRAYWFDASFAGFEGRTLTTGNYLEEGL